jgi:hypothetical protein
LTAILISAAVTCVASLFLGQAALRLAGAFEWSWLAPSVGISVAMLVAVPALHLPGGCTAVAILLGLLTIASIVWCGLDPAHRPPAWGLVAVAPVAALTLLPFLTAGHSGILGVSFNNDTAAHMLFAEGYLAGEVGGVAPPDYPLGPHAFVAVVAQGSGFRIDRVLAGLTIATPLICAWTALAFVDRAHWVGKAITATVVGMPFLIAAYYGQGAFKDVLQACLVLGIVVFFCGRGPTLSRGRWVPLALLLGGVLSVYSTAGLPWALTIGGLWLLATAGIRIRREGGVGGLLPAALRELPSLGIAAAVLVLSISPQLPRIWRFTTSDGSATIAKDDIGNLIGPIPIWEAFGVWNSPDFRLPASPPFTAGMWSAFVLGLVLFGVVSELRRGRWMLPLAAAGALLVWAVSDQTQSPYVTAKALVILSPILLALAVVPLVERVNGRVPGAREWVRRPLSGRTLSWGLAAILIVVLTVRVGASDVEALRASPVGPTDHVDELRDLRSQLGDRRTLFLGNDDYIRWELAGVQVEAPVIGVPMVPTRPQKQWSYGLAHDFDSVEAAYLNTYEWVITTRDPAGSEPPPAFRLVRTTPSFALWRRDGRVGARNVLAEGEMSGATLDCGSPAGRRILRGGGVAAVRQEPVVAELPILEPDGVAIAQLPLSPGRWELGSTYLSRLPVRVTAPGLSAQLPPNLDRPGPRWPIGRIAVAGKGPTTITFDLQETALSPQMAVAELDSVVAVPVAKSRIIAIDRACGKYIDWYRPARR